MVADRAGVVTPFAMINLQERAAGSSRSRPPGVRGHDRGRELPRGRHGREHHQGEEKLTNTRGSSETFENLTPPRKLTLEECLEFPANTSVEVTPEAIHPQGGPDANELLRLPVSGRA
ncbi:hypothetical protein QJS66_22070 [Kocuria rhizophila]|nr:hypothetical protein QJS66_22070 [Kocuria rhizophila]